METCLIVLARLQTWRNLNVFAFGDISVLAAHVPSDLRRSAHLLSHLGCLKSRVAVALKAHARHNGASPTKPLTAFIAPSLYTRLMLFTFARTKHIRAEYSHRAFSICIHQSLLTENRSARKRRGKQRKLHLIKSISFFFTFGRVVSRDRSDKIDNRPNLIGDALDSVKSVHIKIF